MKSKNKALKISIVALSIFIVLSLVGFIVLKSPVRYKHALNLIEKGQYYKAYNILYRLGDYKDNIEIMKNFTHNYTLEVITDSEGDKDETTYEYYENGNLKGKSFYAVDGSKSEFKYTYDDKGQLIKETLTKTAVSGNIDTTTTLYEYDENGRLIKEMDEEMPMLYHEYIYDEKGNLLKRVNHSGKPDYEYTYDDKSNLTQEKYYDISGEEISNQYDYTYDENNNLIKIIEKSNTVNTAFITEGFYDSKGNLIKMAFYTEGSEYKTTVEISYDDKGNIVKTSNNGASTVRKMLQHRYIIEEGEVWFTTIPDSTTENTYDEKGNEIKSVTIDTNGNKTTTESTYNDECKLIKSIVSNPDGTQRISEYKYDAYGNLLERKLSKDGAVIQIIEYSDFVGSYNK